MTETAKTRKRHVITDDTPVDADDASVFRKLCIDSLKPVAVKAGGNVDTATAMDLLSPPKVFIQTGIYALDNILSGGSGLPGGRFVEIFGPESSGKTALCEFLLGRFKAIGGVLHYIDTEYARDDAHLACYGVTPDDLITPDLPDLEAVWDYIVGVCEVLNKSNADRAKDGKSPVKPNLVVFDSVAATPSRSELEEDSHDDSHVAEQARSNAKGVRKTVRRFSASDAVLICVNQNREKIGQTGYGPKTDTPGGRALKYAYSLRLKLAKVEQLYKGSEADKTVIGHIIEVTTVKNKVAPQNQSCKLVLSYLRGIDVNWSNFLWFQEHRYITASGRAGYTFKGCPDTFKRSAFSQFCADHKELIAKAVEECLAEDRKQLIQEKEAESPSTSED